MFKFRSYNVKKATEKDEKKQASSASNTPSYSAMTLRKPPRKEKKKASPNEITLTNNKQSPEYKRNTSVSGKNGKQIKHIHQKQKKKNQKKKMKALIYIKN